MRKATNTTLPALPMNFSFVIRDLRQDAIKNMIELPELDKNVRLSAAVNHKGKEHGASVLVGNLQGEMFAHALIMLGQHLINAMEQQELRDEQK